MDHSSVHINHISDVMISMFTLSTEDRMFEPLSVKPKKDRMFEPLTVKPKKDCMFEPPSVKPKRINLIFVASPLSTQY